MVVSEACPGARRLREEGAAWKVRSSAQSFPFIPAATPTLPGIPDEPKKSYFTLWRQNDPFLFPPASRRRTPLFRRNRLQCPSEEPPREPREPVPATGSAEGGGDHPSAHRYR